MNIFLRKLFLSSILILVFCVFSVNAASATTNFDTPKTVITSHEDFDVLLIDMVIPDSHGVEDVLEAMTLKNEGSISYNVVDSLNLWADAGFEGFQGLNIDKKLGSFKWTNNINGWALSDINTKIPVGGLRVFISVDFKSVSNSEEWFRVRLHALEDLNHNASYDFGDYGLYVKSDNDGVPVMVNVYNEVNIKKRNDYLGPRIFMTNLTANSIVGYGDTYVLLGVTKDRLNSGVVNFYTRIDTDGVEGDWYKGELERIGETDMFSWKYTWNNIMPNIPYDVNLRIEDTKGNRTEKKIENITFVKNFNKNPDTNTDTTTDTNTNTTSNSTEVSIENSEFFVNRDLGVRAPFEDTDIYLKVRLKDKDNKPIANKFVTIHAMRPGKTIKMTLVTNEQGEALWTITSSIDNTFTFKLVFDDNKELPQQPSIRFIDATLGGELIKGKTSSAVYLLRDGKRFVFPTQSVYESYYSDFSQVRVVTDSELAQYQLGGNITYRPGSLIKVPSLSKVYRVNQNNEINWIESEEKARLMYGPTWASLVHDVNDSYFINYTIGDRVQ